jgi:hypothetical protein
VTLYTHACAREEGRAGVCSQRPVENEPHAVRRHLDAGRVPAYAKGVRAGRRQRASAPQIFTRTADHHSCSQKMTMIPWNSPSGPNSGNAVAAIPRSTPSRPVIRSRA